MPFRAALLALSCLVLLGLPRAIAQLEPMEASAPRLDRGVILRSQTGVGFPGAAPIAARGERLDAPFDVTDFSVSVRFNVRGAGTIASRGAMDAPSGKRGWSIELNSDGSVTFEIPSQTVKLQTAPGAWTAGQPHAISVVVRRDPRQPLSGIWIDGVELASSIIKPGSLNLRGTVWTGGGGLFGRTDAFVMHDRALSRPEILEWALGNAPKTALKPFAGAFDIQDGEVIAVLGGTEAVGMMEEGRFEAALLLHARGRRVSLRNLAWQADTVFRQDRPMNFGDLRQQLRRCGATTVMLMFGREECLERGPDGVQPFYEALGKIVQACLEQTPRLVFIGPPPFEKVDAPLRDLSAKNAILASYGEPVLALAEQHQGLFVNVQADWPDNARGWTSDGLQLNSQGQRLLADILVRHLMPTDALPGDQQVAVLKPLLTIKNQLWHDYWRPTNWAFLHGDRTAQPSSRDHIDPSKRWFPAEMERYRDLIHAKEQELWRLAGEPGGKLP